MTYPLPIVFGTDTGPQHSCGSTIYRYDAKAFTINFREETTIFATCMCCGRNAAMFRVGEMPSTVKEIREVHEHVVSQHGETL